MLHFPDNTTSCFTTHLSHEIRLTGEWQVGIAEMHIPCTMMHFQTVESNYTFNLGEVKDPAREGYRISFPHGVYENIEQLAAEINKSKIVEEHQKLEPSHHRKGYYSLYRKCDCDNVHLTIYNEKIRRIFGFESKKFMENSTFKTFSKNGISVIDATRPASLSRAIPDQLYVYTDICEPHTVGDTQAALLRIVSLDTSKYKFGGNIVRQFAPIHYVPLLHYSFQNIVIDIRDQYGEHAPFTSGTSIVTLHLRKKL